MTDFKLNFVYNDINDASLFEYDVDLHNTDCSVLFSFDFMIEYAIKDSPLMVCKGGHGYHNYVNEEDNILNFMKKLKARDLPVEYRYEHKNLDMDESYLNILVEDKTTYINTATLLTSDTLLKSIEDFFKNVLERKYHYVIQNDAIEEFTSEELKKLCESEYAPEEFKTLCNNYLSNKTS